MLRQVNNRLQQSSHCLYCSHVNNVYDYYFVGNNIVKNPDSAVTSFSTPNFDLSGLLETLNPQASARLKEAEIIMVARAGSFLYGLQTPQSDVDYIIVFADPPEVTLTS